ncbi:uncharacterized protein N7482_005022, partial [Penicillium canariense]
MLSVTDLVINLGASVAIIFVSRFIWNYLRSPLKAFPGPAATSFTNLWRLYDVSKGRCDITQNALHRKYGPAVRLGPRMLSLSDPSLINQVYTVKSPWQKSDMYNVNDVLVGGMRLSNLFSTQDEQWHSTFIRPVKGLYSMTKVQDMEPGVDKTINVFFEKLRERFARPGQICEMSDYLHFFAWDAMSQITFSKDLGILEAGSDYKGFLGRSNKSLDYFAAISQIPLLDMVLDKNPIVRIGPPTFMWANIFSVEQLQERLQKGPLPAGQTDYLDRFLEAKKKYPEIVNDNIVVTYLLSNVLAGSDTTASTMCSAVYHILKHPSVHKKLVEELRSTNIALPAKWKELQGLKYFDAVMREAMRVTPGIGQTIERIVPRGGFSLPDGRFVPEGTIVGMNPSVINRNEAVFGAHTESFLPERWLPSPGESDDMYQARFAKMKGADFTFGGGTRACLGRYLSLLEAYKLIASLFISFDLELPNQDQEWQLTHSWFVRQTGIPVRITERPAT